MSGQLCANLIFSELRNPPPPEQQEAPPPQAWLAPVKSCHFSPNLLTGHDWITVPGTDAGPLEVP